MSNAIYRIFISCNSKDFYRVKTLKDDLEKLGYSIWLDQELGGGQVWRDHVCSYIQRCDLFLCVLTQHWLDSFKNGLEFDYATKLGKNRLPVLVESGLSLDSLPPGFADLDNIDYRKAGKATLRNLIKAISRLSPVPTRGVGPPSGLLSPLIPIIEHLNTPTLSPEQQSGILESLEALLDDPIYKADARKSLEKLHDHHEIAPAVSQKIAQLLQDSEVSVTQPQLDRVGGVLPGPFEWVEIPAGRITLEGIQKTTGAPSFYIARYAITNAQFDVFIENGYADERWWHYSDSARQWHTAHPNPREKAFNSAPTQPRVNVSWYEAIAFCLWLSEQTAQQIMLPSESQWQRAAQGNDGRDFAWGDEEPRAGLANWGSNVGQTTPVDSYPDQARLSAYGLFNISGNVWDWCLNDFGSIHTDISRSSENRVLRGGGWYNVGSDLRVVRRYAENPAFRSNDVGFRCALSY